MFFFLSQTPVSLAVIRIVAPRWKRGSEGFKVAYIISTLSFDARFFSEYRIYCRRICSEMVKRTWIFWYSVYIVIDYYSRSRKAFFPTLVSLAVRIVAARWKRGSEGSKVACIISNLALSSLFFSEYKYWQRKFILGWWRETWIF